jgi:hypothetical protein
MTSPETLELEAVDAALAGRYVAPEHAELADLALLLRDDRPEPSLTWTTHLDRRVEAGFPAKPKRRRVWLRKAAPALAIAACLLPVVGLAALAGDSDFGGGEDAESGSSGDSGAMEEQATDDAGGGSVAAPPAVDRASRNPGSDRLEDRSQQRSASLTLAAPPEEIDRVAARIGQVTADVGGFVQSSTVSTSGGGSFQLRVPSDQLDTAIQRLSELGRMRDLTRRSVDITADVVSARERLGDARAERKSLLKQLADADTLNETESLRARLEIVSREIAAARRVLRRVNNQANFADVSVELVPSRGSADDGAGAWTPGDAWGDALRVLEVVAGVALIAAAVVLPIALVWLLAWLALRGVSRRRRERALDMA